MEHTPHDDIRLVISPTLAQTMDRALIFPEDARRTIIHCENSGVKLQDNDTGELVGHLREGALTYWVRYSYKGGVYTLRHIYSHRAKIEEKSDMSEPVKASTMTCLKCDKRLIEQKTVFKYLNSVFSTPLPRCPVCGQVYISEEFVSGKLKDVEETLEDK